MAELCRMVSQKHSSLHIQSESYVSVHLSVSYIIALLRSSVGLYLSPPCVPLSLPLLCHILKQIRTHTDRADIQASSTYNAFYDMVKF